MHVMHLLPDLAIGGGQQVALNLVVHRSYAQVTVLGIGRDATLAQEFQQAGARVHVLALEDRGWIRTIWDVLRLSLLTRPELIHVHVGRDRRIGQLVALVTRTPVVSHLHGIHDHLPALTDRNFPYRHLGRLLRQSLNRSIERRAVRRYIAVSNPIRELHAGRRHAPVDVILNGIDTIRFSPDARLGIDWRSRHGIARTSLVVLSVGRLVSGKGHQQLVSAFSEIPGYLILVGDGPERDKIREAVMDLELSNRVMILPFTRQLREIYVAADIFVLASEKEGLPLVVLEAMASQIPVIALRIPGIEQIIDDGVNGVLIDDLTQLPNAIASLTAEKGAAIGRAARQRAQTEFSASAMTAHVESIYREVLSEPVNSSRLFRRPLWSSEDS